MTRIIVFDFDGVLVDSNRIKQEAFFGLFSDTGETAQSLIKKITKEIPFHFSSLDVLRKAFSELRYMPDSIQKLCSEYEQRYRKTVKERILEHGVVSGIYEMLNILRQEGRSLYINSATPHSALAELVNELDLEKYFSRAYGRPPSKVANLIDIMTREHAKADELVMIGDGKEDVVSAKTLNVPFIGIANGWNGWASATDFPVAENVFAAVARLKIMERET